MILWNTLQDDPRRICPALLLASFDGGELAAKGGKRSLSSIHPNFAAQMCETVCKATARAGLVLSVGCGAGEVESMIAAKNTRVLALDMRPVLPGDHPNLRVVQADAHTLPLRTACCDTVLFSESIGQVIPEQVFAEAARVLQPEGRLVLSTYQLPPDETAQPADVPFPWAGATPWHTTQAQVDTALKYYEQGMYRLYPEALLLRFLREAGFCVETRSCVRYAIGESGYTDILVVVATPTA